MERQKIPYLHLNLIAENTSGDIDPNVYICRHRTCKYLSPVFGLDITLIHSMDIQNQFDDFKAWAENLGILLVEADFEEKKSPVVEIPGIEDNSLSTFQKLIEKLGSKIIIFETLKFDKDKFNLYESAVDKSDDKDIQKKFQGFRHYEDKFLGYVLLTFSEGMTFRFSKYIKDIDDYLEIESAALDYIEDHHSKDSEYKEI